MKPKLGIRLPIEANDQGSSNGRQGKGAACAGCSAKFPAELSEEFAQTEGKATVGRCHQGQPFGEYAPGTAWLITVELTDMQMQDDLDILNRQIPDLALIATMDPMSRSTTHGTAGSRRDSFIQSH